MCPSHLSAGECGVEYDFNYVGNNVAGKAVKTGTKDVASCKSHCHSENYFTWDSKEQKCWCKSSASGRRHAVGFFSGRANCQGKFDRDLRIGIVEV